MAITKTLAAQDPAHRVRGAWLGARIGDALAMPVHWYYDRTALRREAGEITGYLTPRNPHPGSILWRSRWEAPSAELDILGEQRRYWGQHGVHYHQHLAAGENTLTLKIAALVWESLHAKGGHDPDDFLRRYIDLLTHPERHRDTYLEECHRGFFTNLGRGLPPRRCAVQEKHIGGLALMLPVALFYTGLEEEGRHHALAQLALTHAGQKMRVAAEAVLSLLYPVLQGEASLVDAVRLECQRQRNPHFGHPYLRWLEEDDDRVVGHHLSTACYVEDAVPAVIYLALKYAGQPAQGLLANTRLGGDNAHRGAVLGALLGAEHGDAAWPQEWVEGLVPPPEPGP